MDLLDICAIICCTIGMYVFRCNYSICLTPAMLLCYPYFVTVQEYLPCFVHKLIILCVEESQLAVNPFSAMGDFRHHIMVNLAYLGVKESTYGLIVWVKCSSERFIMVKSVF